MIEFLSNTAHLHLLLNHVPTTAFFGALVLFVIGLLQGNDTLKKWGLALFVVVAAITIATYTSGSAAEAWLRGTNVKPELPGSVVSAAIHEHEDSALWATVLMELTGCFAWLALWQWKSVRALRPWSLPVVLVLALGALVTMSRTAYLGGHISHIEVRPEVVARHQACLALVDAETKRPGSVPNAPENCPWQKAVDDVEGAAAGRGAPQRSGEGATRDLGMFVTGRTWVWPTLETMHFVGLCLLFTTVLVVNLRLLGMIKAVPYSAVYQLLPLGMIGFGINLITGMLFFVGVPAQYNANAVFYWKIVFILLGGLNLTYFMVVDDAWTAGANVDATASSKIAAASAIVIWMVVLFCGHMLPFIGNAF